MMPKGKSKKTSKQHRQQLQNQRKLTGLDAGAGGTVGVGVAGVGIVVGVGPAGTHCPGCHHHHPQAGKCNHGPGPSKTSLKQPSSQNNKENKDPKTRGEKPSTSQKSILKKPIAVTQKLPVILDPADDPVVLDITDAVAAAAAVTAPKTSAVEQETEAPRQTKSRTVGKMLHPSQTGILHPGPSGVFLPHYPRKFPQNAKMYDNGDCLGIQFKVPDSIPKELWETSKPPQNRSAIAKEMVRLSNQYHSVSNFTSYSVAEKEKKVENVLTLEGLSLENGSKNYLMSEDWYHPVQLCNDLSDAENRLWAFADKLIIQATHELTANLTPLCTLTSSPTERATTEALTNEIFRRFSIVYNNCRLTFSRILMGRGEDMKDEQFSKDLKDLLVKAGIVKGGIFSAFECRCLLSMECLDLRFLKCLIENKKYPEELVNNKVYGESTKNCMIVLFKTLQELKTLDKNAFEVVIRLVATRNATNSDILRHLRGKVEASEKKKQPESVEDTPSVPDPPDLTSIVACEDGEAKVIEPQVYNPEDEEDDEDDDDETSEEDNVFDDVDPLIIDVPLASTGIENASFTFD